MTTLLDFTRAVRKQFVPNYSVRSVSIVFLAKTKTAWDDDHFRVISDPQVSETILALHKGTKGEM
jgi:hypothetical protein